MSKAVTPIKRGPSMPPRKVKVKATTLPVPVALIPLTDFSLSMHNISSRVAQILIEDIDKPYAGRVLNDDQSLIISKIDAGLVQVLHDIEHFVSTSKAL